MFPTWRLRLREARVAWQAGRYDDAATLVTAESLRDFLPAKQLASDVAAKIVQRAGDRFAQGDSLAGWNDLATANRLGGQSKAIRGLRNRYAATAVEEVVRFLAAGQTAPALERLEKLHKRGLTDEKVRVLKQVASLMHEIEVTAARGHFAEASAAAAKAAGLLKAESSAVGTMEGITHYLDEQQTRLASQGAECQRLSAEMHAALVAQNWSAALAAADALLAAAPGHVAAAQARRRAWKAVGMNVTQPHAGRVDRAGRRGGRLPVSLQLNHHARRSTHSGATSEVETMTGEQPRRALLWVDAVGGFLVCLDDYITLGQPAPGEPTAVPILADLSRRHAAIRRDAGAYVLEPLQEVKVNGRVITGPHVLADGELIQLGDNVRVRFTKPHALSATALLRIESHHKTQPSADAVLLMADSCVLGPNRHCHIRCRDWQHDVVVYRQNDSLYCRADETLSVDGVEATGECAIDSGVRVEGEEFSFTWETVT